MNCIEIRRILKAWIDGEVEETTAERVEAHLAACEACRAVAADFRSFGRLLREAPEAEVARVDAGEIHGRAVCAEREEEGVIRLLQRAAAVAAAVLVLSALFWLMPSAGETPDDGFAAGARERAVETPKGGVEGGKDPRVDEDAALASFLSNLNSWPDAVAIGDY